MGALFYSIVMQHAGAVLVETGTDTGAAELQRIGVDAPFGRLAVRRKTTGGGQPTGARTGTQYRDSCSDQQHFDDIGTHGTAPPGMKRSYRCILGAPACRQHETFAIDSAGSGRAVVSLCAYDFGST